MTAELKNLKVLNNYIIIKPFQQPNEETTEGGLIVAKNPGDPNLIYHYAKVVGVGEVENTWTQSRVNIGDVIYYAQKKASALAIVEEGYIYDPRKANYAYILPEDVIAVVVKDDEDATRDDYAF